MPEDLNGLDVPEDNTEGSTEPSEPSTPQTEAASKAELQSVVETIKTLAENQQATQESVKSLTDAILNTPYESDNEPVNAPVQPDADDSEVDWNALASEPDKFAKAVIKAVAAERKVDTANLVDERDKKTEMAARNQRLLDGVRNQDPEMFDALQEHGMFQKVATRLMNEDADKYRRMQPDQFFDLVFKTASTNLTASVKELAALVRKRHQKEADATSERPGPGGPRNRLKRDYTSDDVPTRKTVEDAFEETKHMFDAAEADAKAASTII
jgi:hypothetical protein